MGQSENRGTPYLDSSAKGQIDHQIKRSNRPIGIIIRVFTSSPEDQIRSQVKSHQRLKKCDASLLNSQHYKVRIKEGRSTYLSEMAIVPLQCLLAVFCLSLPLTLSLPSEIRVRRGIVYQRQTWGRKTSASAGPPSVNILHYWHLCIKLDRMVQF